MKILVTGGAGFIGSYLVDSLVSKGHNVTVLDNLSSGSKQNLNSSSSFIQGDLKNPSLQDPIQDFDIVYHLAANPDVRLGETNKKIHIQENIITTHNLLEAMRKNKIKKLVFTSTSAVYGLASTIPTPESYGPLKPISLYAASKLAAEALVSSYSEFGIQSWIFRLANIIGPKSDHGVIPDFIRKLDSNPNQLEVLGDGTQTKSYLHISDCIDAILFAVQNSNQKTNIFNIGSPDTISVSEIAKLVIQAKSPSASISYTGGKQGWKGDVPKFLLDISKIRNLGWKPNHNSRQSVTKTIKETLNQ